MSPAIASPLPWTPALEVEQRIRVELLGAAGEPAGTTAPPEGLHVCPACDRPFVVPGDVYEVVGVDRVLLELRCMDCGWAETREHADAALEALDRELDRGYADLLWALEVVWLGNEEAAIVRFTDALAADAILPEDF